MSVKRRCNGCGAYYDFEFGVTTICKYCGTKHLISFNEDTFERIKQANSYRLVGEFEKCIEIYNELIEKHPKSSELRFGRFLAKYCVTDSEALSPSKILTVNSVSVYDDEDYNMAIEYDLYKKADYKKIAGIIEERRLVNTDFYKCICNNEYCSMVVSANHNCGARYSDELYEKIHTCFDVYYPDVTTASFVYEDREVAMELAVDMVKALYVVIDGDCTVDERVKNLVERFLKKHKKNFLVLVTTNQDKCAELKEKAGNIINIGDNAVEEVIEDIKSTVCSSFSEFKEFKAKGKKVKDEFNPSPIIHI